MALRTVEARQVKRTLVELIREAAYTLPAPVLRLVDRAILREETVLGKRVLGAIKTNARLAGRLSLPVCQDTGLVEVFCNVGDRVRLKTGRYAGFEQLAAAAAAEACGFFHLRASVVDPLTRENTGNNAPAIVHVRLVRGEKLQLAVMLKGFGSENVGRVANLHPGAEAADIADFVVGCVREAGSSSCPPVIIGCGIGGTMEKAALLAREVLLAPEKLARPNRDPGLRALERDILRRVNRLGVGPGGLGGRATALAVRAGKYPTHIAGLPVAVNISCWALRTASATL